MRDRAVLAVATLCVYDQTAGASSVRRCLRRNDGVKLKVQF